MGNNNLEICVVDVKHMSIYSFSSDTETAKEKLQKALISQQEDIKTWEGHCDKYPNRDSFKIYLKQARESKYKIMTYDEYLEMERKYYINEPLTEITEEKFEDMLNVLPPLKWCTKKNIEMFCNSEMLTGTYTSQYLHDKTNNKFYHKIVDVTDQSTWGHNFI